MYTKALLVATSLIFLFGLSIAVVTEILKGPQLITSLSIAFATAFGPVAIVALFLRVGFDEVLRQAAIESFEKEFKKLYDSERQKLGEIKNDIFTQLEECRKSSQNLIDSTATLSVLRRCGVVEAFEKRAEAYELIKSWLKDRNNQEFIFVGTSFRGLYWKEEGDPKILDLIENLAEENPNFINNPHSLFLRFIFTHPAFAYLRQRAEGTERPDSYFSIREEILRSVLMLRNRGIPEGCIKFYKGTPTFFGIMTDHSIFINPYPYKKQSYTSFGFVVERTDLKEDWFSLYRIYRDSHFEGVWRDVENTVPWEDSKLADFWKSTLEKVVPERFDENVPLNLKKAIDKIEKKAPATDNNGS